MNGEELVELLRRRHGILRALVDEPRPRHELVDALPDSKSTTYKGLTQLQEAGLVERVSDGFAPTLFGTVALARYDALAATADAGDLLAGHHAGDIEPAALVGAEIIRPDVTDAERHLEALWSLLDAADSARGIAPVVAPSYVKRFLAYTEAGLDAELVLPTEVIASLRTDDPDALAAAATRATLYETTAAVPFGVLVTDGASRRMAIELRDGAMVTGLITNDTPDALAWAEATVERMRADAGRVVLDDDADHNEG